MDAHLFCFIVEEKKIDNVPRTERMTEVLKLAAAVENAILFSSVFFILYTVLEN